jgi:hypothetical protein
VSALVDRAGRFVWACVPRIDGDPAFSALLTSGGSADDQGGVWSIELEGGVAVEQHYFRNTPILVSRFSDSANNAVEVIDFCPRVQRPDRTYRPVAFVRVVRPVSGRPRIVMRLRPTHDYGRSDVVKTLGSNHIRYHLQTFPMRLTCSAPVSLVDGELPFRVERPLHFFFGPDESFAGDIGSTIDQMLADTVLDWQLWVRGLATPVEWQDAVIRAAIGLKLCQYEETGAIVAALTASIPEHADSGRNWDYRYCWIRDAYYTVQALNRLGALDVLEGYLGYLRNIVDGARGGHVQPLYGLLGETILEETIASSLNGYRGMGPVRIGGRKTSKPSSVSANRPGGCTTSLMLVSGSFEPDKRSIHILLRCAGRRAIAWPTLRKRWICPAAAISGAIAPSVFASGSSRPHGGHIRKPCRPRLTETSWTPA